MITAKDNVINGESSQISFDFLNVSVLCLFGRQSITAEREHVHETDLERHTFPGYNNLHKKALRNVTTFFF